MSDLEEILQSYQAAGVNLEFAPNTSQVLPQGNVNPRQVIQQQAFQSSTPDFSMLSREFSLSLDKLTNKLDNYVETINKLTLQNVQKRETSYGPGDLIASQQRYQQVINASQINPAWAQAMNPYAFPDAAPLQYQTYPQNALFRHGITPAGQRVAAGPKSSLLSDIMMLSPGIRSLVYEPAFAEDAFQRTIGSRERINERIYRAQDIAGNIGGQLAGGVASTSMLGAAGRAIGLPMGGKIIGGMLGGPLGILDMALGLSGMPSFSGAVSSGVSHVYGATAGRYFSNLDMTRDIRNVTKFYTGPGSDITGQGLSADRAAKVVSSLHSLNVKDYSLTTKDYANIFNEASQSGLLSQAGNEEGMIRNMKSLSKNLRLFMRLSGDPDYKNAIKSMGDLFKLGIQVSDLQNASLNINNFSKMAGMNMQQSAVFGQQGAMAFQQVGVSPGVGYQVGTMMRGVTRVATQAGQFTPGVLATLGGEEGVSQQLTGSTAAFAAGPVGDIFLAGFLKRKSGGGFGVDKNAINGMLSKGDFMGTLENGRRNLGNTKDFENFFVNKRILREQVMNELGPTGLVATQMATIKTFADKTGVSYETAAMGLLGEEAGFTFSRAYNVKTLPQLIEATRKQNAIQQYNARVQDESANGILARLRVGAKELFEPIGKTFDEIAQNRMQRVEERRARDVGTIAMTSVGDITKTEANFNKMRSYFTETDKNFFNRRKNASNFMDTPLTVNDSRTMSQVMSTYQTLEKEDITSLNKNISSDSDILTSIDTTILNKNDEILKSIKVAGFGEGSDAERTTKIIDKIYASLPESRLVKDDNQKAQIKSLIRQRLEKNMGGDRKVYDFLNRAKKIDAGLISEKTYDNLHKKRYTGSVAEQFEKFRQDVNTDRKNTGGKGADLQNIFQNMSGEEAAVLPDVLGRISGLPGADTKRELYVEVAQLGPMDPSNRTDKIKDIAKRYKISPEEVSKVFSMVNRNLNLTETEASAFNKISSKFTGSEIIEATKANTTKDMLSQQGSIVFRSKDAQKRFDDIQARRWKGPLSKDEESNLSREEQRLLASDRMMSVLGDNKDRTVKELERTYDLASGMRTEGIDEAETKLADAGAPVEISKNQLKFLIDIDKKLARMVQQNDKSYPLENAVGYNEPTGN